MPRPPEAANLTKSGVFKGKIAYIAPEQARGDKVDRRADVFSVGVMLWEALACKKIGNREVELMTLNNRITDSDPKIREAAPDAPDALLSICERAMDHERDARYATAAEMREEIDAFLSDHGEPSGAKHVAALVTKAFANKRDAIAATIEEQVNRHRRAGEGRVSLVSLSEIAPQSEQTPSAQTPSEIASQSEQTPSDEAAASQRPTSDRQDGVHGSMAPSTHTPPTGAATLRVERKSALTTWLGLSAVAAVAVVALLLLRPSDESQPLSDEAVSEQPPAGVVSAESTAVPAESVAVGAATTVRLTIAVEPADATVTLDGAMLTEIPFSAEVAIDKVLHRVKVSKDGYESTTQVIAFDRDQRVSIALQKAETTKPRPVAVAPGGRKSRAAPKMPKAGDDLSTVKPRPVRKIDATDPYQ